MIICMICDQPATIIRPHHTGGFPACEKCNTACNSEIHRLMHADLYGPPAAGNYRNLAELSISAGDQPRQSTLNPYFLDA